MKYLEGVNEIEGVEEIEGQKQFHVSEKRREPVLGEKERRAKNQRGN